MLQAMLRGKLRREEGMEDLLTSNTFGLLKYLGQDDLLLPFLGEAYSPHLGRLPAQFRSAVAKVERWRFWPTLAYPGCVPCEPDVEIVLLHCDGTRSGLLIEAKYRSGKSSVASDADERPNDQLAREYDNLSCLAQEEGFARFAVIYLTADWLCPQEELEESADEYRQKRGQLPGLYWLSWRTLARILELAAEQGNAMMADLYALFLRLELTTFCRLRHAGLSIEGWRFNSGVRWGWLLPEMGWAFTLHSHANEPRYDWALPSTLSDLYKWRPS